MLMKDFIQRVQGLLSAMIYDDSTLCADELFEANRSLRELTTLFNKNVNSEKEILNEDSLKPFLNFLANRWVRSILIGGSYQNHPLSKINLTCQVLAQEILVELQKIKYKPRTVEEILMPKAKIPFRQFLQDVLFDLDEYQMIFSVQLNPFFYFESVFALNSLRALVQLHLADNQLDQFVSLSNVQDFLQLLENRWVFIRQTEADYTTQEESIANQIYINLAKTIYYSLALNGERLSDFKVEDFVMPRVTLRDNYRSNELMHRIFSVLEDNDCFYSPQVSGMREQLSQLGTELFDFAARILLEIEKYTETNTQHLPLLVKLENRRALQQLNQFMEDLADQDGSFTAMQVEIVYELLSKRWQLIELTEAAFHRSPHTPANQICQQIAHHLRLISYEINYQGQYRISNIKNNPASMTKEEANQQLARALTETIKTSNQLIAEMLWLPATEWEAYLKLFETNKLINLLSNGGNTIEEVFKTAINYNQDENRSRAILLCLLEVYIRDRQKINSTYTGYGSSIASIFVSIPTLEDKKEAVLAVRAFLVSGEPLTQFSYQLEEMSSSLYPHRLSLKDSRLKVICEQIEAAVAELPKPQLNEIAYGVRK